MPIFSRPMSSTPYVCCRSLVASAAAIGDRQVLPEQTKSTFVRSCRSMMRESKTPSRTTSYRSRPFVPLKDADDRRRSRKAGAARIDGERDVVFQGRERHRGVGERLVAVSRVDGREGDRPVCMGKHVCGEHVVRAAKRHRSAVAEQLGLGQLPVFGQRGSAFGGQIEDQRHRAGPELGHHSSCKIGWLADQPDRRCGGIDMDREGPARIATQRPQSRHRRRPIETACRAVHRFRRQHDQFAPVQQLDANAVRGSADQAIRRCRRLR